MKNEETFLQKVTIHGPKHNAKISTHIFLFFGESSILSTFAILEHCWSKISTDVNDHGGLNLKVNTDGIASISILINTVNQEILTEI